MKKEYGNNRISWVEERFFNFRPAFFVAIFLAIGIFHASSVLVDDAPWQWAFLLLPVLLAFAFSKNRKKTAIAVGALFLAYGLGFGLFSAQYSSYTRSKTYEGEYAVTGTVVEFTEGEGKTRTVLTDITIGGEASEYKLVAYLPSSFSVSLSDRITFDGWVTTYAAEHDGSFDGSRIAEKMRYVVYYPKSPLKFGESYDLFRAVRARIVERIDEGMDPTAAGLTKALTLGDVSGIEEGLLDNIRFGGIAHIFAVSGLHIAALYGFCRLLTDKTKFFYAPALVRFLFVAAILLFYGGVCGFSASVVRAIVMCLVSYACGFSFLYNDSLDSIGVAAVVVLCISPSLLFDVGFQLSFLACVGIGMGSGRIFRLIRGDAKWLNRLVEDRQVRAERESGRRGRTPLGLIALAYRRMAMLVSVTLSAQIATVPVLLNTFGYISGLGILLNLVLVPLVAAAFSGLLLLVFFAAIFPRGAARLFLTLPSVVWTAISVLFETVDFSKFAIVGEMSAGAVVAYYLLAVLLTDKINLKRRRFAYVAAAAALLLLTLLI